MPGHLAQAPLIRWKGKGNISNQPGTLSIHHVATSYTTLLNGYLLWTIVHYLPIGYVFGYRWFGYFDSVSVFLLPLRWVIMMFFFQWLNVFFLALVCKKAYILIWGSCRGIQSKHSTLIGWEGIYGPTRYKVIYWRLSKFRCMVAADEIKFLYWQVITFILFSSLWSLNPAFF